MALDYNAINSAHATIRRHKPLSFFKLFHETDEQFEGYIRTLRALESDGYCEWHDNFGGLMLSTEHIEALEGLMRYVCVQNRRGLTRTIYYLDILAVQESEREFISQVIKTY